MGPRPFDRGNEQEIEVKKKDLQMLQWGRDHSIAETIGNWLGGLLTGKLQWGRDHSIAETLMAHSVDVQVFRASMGPRPFDRGNTICPVRLFQVIGASMGPRPFDRGNPVLPKVSAPSA